MGNQQGRLIKIKIIVDKKERGEGHYKPIIRGSQTIEEATKEYNDIIYRDKLKNEFCKAHNIKLIRIPYWEYENIETILKEQLF